MQAADRKHVCRAVETKALIDVLRQKSRFAEQHSHHQSPGFLRQRGGKAIFEFDEFFLKYSKPPCRFFLQAEIIDISAGYDALTEQMSGVVKAAGIACRRRFLKFAAKDQLSPPQPPGLCGRPFSFSFSETGHERAKALRQPFPAGMSDLDLESRPFFVKFIDRPHLPPVVKLPPAERGRYFFRREHSRIIRPAYGKNYAHGK